MSHKLSVLFTLRQIHFVSKQLHDPKPAPVSAQQDKISVGTGRTAGRVWD